MRARYLRVEGALDMLGGLCVQHVLACFLLYHACQAFFLSLACMRSCACPYDNVFEIPLFIYVCGLEPPYSRNMRLLSAGSEPELAPWFVADELVKTYSPTGPMLCSHRRSEGSRVAYLSPFCRYMPLGTDAEFVSNNHSGNRDQWPLCNSKVAGTWHRLLIILPETA